MQTATPSFAVLNPSAAPEPSPRKKLLPTDPDPPPPEGLHSIAVGSRDPFEAKGDDGLRVVASYGAIKIGIAKKAHVRDEQQVAAITLALAKELNEKESGRKDDFETRAHEYQPILGGYAAKLQPYMTGEFAFHAGDWILFHSVKDPGAKAP
ncbi:MAG: hypothetical protein HYV09_31845 [Deltaproteobacteria bacterium]|nr:hypothetical protein [Deltaproteobacteria bacterium]